MGGLFDPFSLLLVVGGTLALAIVQHGPSAARAGLAALNLWYRRSDPADEAAAALRLVHAADAAVSHRGLFAAETLAPRHSFLRAALAELADARVAPEFAGRMAELGERAEAADRLPARFWAGIADSAPALGMIGTVAGLIGMASDLGDPAQAGPSLALALTSTLYGLVLSACIAGPLAERADRRADAGARWRAQLAAALTALVAREAWPGMSMGTSTPARRWAVSFADLALLIACMLMLGWRPAAADGATSGSTSPILDVPVAAMFVPGEAMLSARGAALLAPARRAAAAGGLLGVTVGTGSTGSLRLDAWELAAARTAVIADALGSQTLTLAAPDGGNPCGSPPCAELLARRLLWTG